MSISVRDLTKVYGTQKAVDGISFTARPGSVLGFLGPNGAGKSTTMKIMSCFMPQTSGTASICDCDVTSASLGARRLLGYLPEHNPLYSGMYVKESLEFVAGIHDLPDKKRRIREVIEMTGLTDEQHKKIGQLSKGYRQRVGLAQAVIHDPQVLILDEPTTGLDPNQLVEMRKLIRELGRTKTVVLSTHIMQEVEAVCDEVVIISKGKIVAYGAIDDIQAANSGRSMEEIFISLTGR